MSAHPAFDSVLGFVMIFVLPLCLYWILMEAITGWTDDFIRRMWDKWRRRK